MLPAAASRQHRRSELSPIEGISVLLVLRAFSSGATAMTGIEAISNAVPALKPPGWRNARTVLGLMLGLLVSMFAGLVIVVHLDGLVPRAGQTLLSQLAHRSLGSGVLYGYVQASTALVLLLAANTAFNGFPRLLSFMAHKGHVPRLFLRLGDRLAFSNGTILLAVAAAAIFAAFDARTDALIPALRRRRVRRLHLLPDRHGRALAPPPPTPLAPQHVLNALGAVLSAVVFVIAAVTKFTEGAWVALLLIALLVLTTSRIRRHYTCVRKALALHPDQPAWMINNDARRPSPQPGGADHRPESNAPARDGEKRRLVVVPVARLDLVEPSRARLRRLARPTRSRSPPQPSRRRSQTLPRILAVLGQPRAPPDRRIALPGADRASRPLHRRAPQPTARHPAHGRTARANRQTLLAAPTPQPGQPSRRALRHQPGIVTTTIPLKLP